MSLHSKKFQQEFSMSGRNILFIIHFMEVLREMYSFFRPNMTCEFNMMCDRLERNPCGDFGLRVIFPYTASDPDGGNQKEDICQVHTMLLDIA